MYLVVGLGNPGDEYKGTRHNIGYEIVEKLANRNFINLNKVKFNSIYGEGNIGGNKVFIMKPTTFMNNSGEAVQQFSHYYKISPENIIIIADDIDIPFSSIRIRPNGSAGSHNGLKSIVNLLNTKNFPRIKVGIGKKHPKQDLASFVLSKFSDEDRPYMDETVIMTSEAIEVFLKEGIDQAMNKFNNKATRAQE